MKKYKAGMLAAVSVLCLAAFGEEAQQSAPALNEKLFSAMDANLDRTISKEEYFLFGKKYMQERNKSFDPSVAEKNFTALDINGNGCIERVEEITYSDKDPRKLVGVWRYWDTEKHMGFITFVFAGDGEADMVTGNVSTRAMALQQGGSMTYTFDPSTDPAALDIIAVGGSGPATTMKCIVQFLDDDRIKLRIAHGKGTVIRPDGFTTVNMGDTLILNRSQYKPSEMRHF